jgi:hypothetical protein
MKFSVAPLSTRAFSLAVLCAHIKEKGVFIALVSLTYMMRMPSAQIQADWFEQVKNPPRQVYPAIHFILPWSSL